MEKLKAAVIGSGFIGPAHVEAIRRLGCAEVVALVGSSKEKAEVKAAELGIPRAYGDYREMLRDADIDVVHVCTPNALHYPMVKDAFAAGKHVLCEKPLAMTVAEAQEMKELAEKSGLVHAVHFNIRFYPLLHHARALVQSGQLGRILAVNGSYQQDWLLKDTDYSWRLEPEKSGPSRAVADIGSHWFDSVEFVTGRRVQRLCADFATFHPTRKKPKKAIDTFSGKVLTAEDYDEVAIDTEDYAGVMFHMEGGTHGTFYANQAAAGRKNYFYLEVYGEKASVVFDGENPNTLLLGRRDEANGQLIRDPALVEAAAAQVITYPGGHAEGFPDTFKQLIKKVYGYILAGGAKSGKAPEFPTFADGLRDQQIIDAIVRSAGEERWVSL